MPRKVAIVAVVAGVGAAVAGSLVGAGVFETNANAFPAPARIPLVVGLNERNAVRAIEAQRLRVEVERRRAPGASHGRVIAQSYGGAKRIGALTMGFEGDTVRVIVAR